MEASAEHDLSNDPENLVALAAAALHGASYPATAQAPAPPEHPNPASSGTEEPLPRAQCSVMTVGSTQISDIRINQRLARSSVAQPVESAVSPNEKQKDDHKKAERHRREKITEGIDKLAEIVPGLEKDKGSILKRVVSYIQQLQDQEAKGIEEREYQRLQNQARIQELEASNNKLQVELDIVSQEVVLWRQSAEIAGQSLL